jgi:hypothetical protein
MITATLRLSLKTQELTQQCKEIKASKTSTKHCNANKQTSWTQLKKTMS